MTLLILIFIGNAPNCEMAKTAPLECVRWYYLQSAEQETAIVDGLAFLEQHAEQLPPALAKAYRAALIVMKARYAFWPQAKMNYLQQGLPVLDQLVDQDPKHMEIRILRLLSIYYLPFFLRRKTMARQDMQMLTEQFLIGNATLPAAYQRMMVEFLLANAPLASSQRAQLQSLYVQLRHSTLTTP